MQRLKDFWLDLPIRWKGILVISIPVGCLAVLLATILFTEVQEREAQQWVIHSEGVRTEARRLLTATLDAQSAVRGYDFTQDERFLKHYSESLREIRQSSVRLKLLVRDNPSQNEAALQLEKLAKERVSLFDRNLEVARRLSNGRRHAALLQNLVSGRTKMEEFRAAMGAFQEEEEALHSSRTARLSQHRRVTAALLWASALLGIVGGLIATQLFSRGVSERVQLLQENAERIGRGDLLCEYPSGLDEIGRLSDRFQEMVRQLGEREQRLRESRNALRETTVLQRAILDSADYAIISTDVDGIIQTFNPAAERLFGYRAEELVGRHTPAVLHDAEDVAARGPGKAPFHVLTERARAGHTDAREWIYVRKDGSRVPVLMSITALHRPEGDVTGFLGVGSDITERRAYERQLVEAREAALDASTAKSEFLASVSHEIRTPMNAIIGMADLLWETPLSDEQRHYVSVFRRAGGTLLQLINDILDLSKVEAGSLDLESTAFSPRELAEQTAEVFAVRAHEKALELACDVKADVPECVKGDPYRVQQILANLIGNAVKFTDAGEVVLRVSRDAHGGLIFAVSDTGAGIPEDRLQQIFEAFTQGDSSTTRRYGGTGLGLTISSRLAELMGGAITVRSTPGAGSTFELRVSLPTTEPLPNAEPAQPVSLDGMRILVADDNATNRLILREILGSCGASVTDAVDGNHAVEAVQAAYQSGSPFDLVLLDGRMPGMDGFQVAGALHERGSLAGTAVMMLTSDNRAGDIQKARELGLGGYLVKPIKRAELLNAISRAMSGKASARAALNWDLDTTRAIEPAGGTSLEVETGSRQRILLVDDSEDNRMLVLAYLKKAPYHVEVAGDGAEGVRKFTSGSYDLVLMDVQMPVMDGYAATRAIRKWEAARGLPATPILAVTANALREDEQRSLEAGCNGHLTKPIKKAVLLKTMEQYLGDTDVAP